MVWYFSTSDFWNITVGWLYHSFISIRLHFPRLWPHQK